MKNPSKKPKEIFKLLRKDELIEGNDEFDAEEDNGSNESAEE